MAEGTGALTLQFLPLLRTQRDLLDTPRGGERFRRYLDALLDGGDDLALPLAVFNPMSKPHVAERLDALLAMGAEEVAAAAMAEAATRLHSVPGTFRVGLDVADDAQGGWTDRHLTEAQHRFQGAAMIKRGFITTLLWTGETATLERVREEVLADIHRALYQRRHGPAETLGTMMTQEGLSAAFAGMTAPALDPAGLARARALIVPHRDTTAFPVAFACLYGDDAAVSVGYPPLGLPPRAGFAVALADAREARLDPVAPLLDRYPPT